MNKNPSKETKKHEQQAKKERLSSEQQKAIVELEFISKNDASCASHCYKLGKILRTIIQEKLYKVAIDGTGENYHSFKKYVGDVLKISDKYAYMLVNSSKVQDLLTERAVAPSNVSEKLLRKLTSYMKTPEKLVELWDKATDGDNTKVPSDKKLSDVVSDAKSESFKKCNSAISITEKLNADELSCTDCVAILREISSKKNTLSDDDLKKLKQKINKFIDLCNKTTK